MNQDTDKLFAEVPSAFWGDEDLAHEIVPIAKVVAITKTARDGGGHKGCPPDFPLECKEYDSVAEAQRLHPGCLVMSIDKYKDYARYFHDMHPAPELSIMNRKHKWWKFWGT